MAFHQQHSPTGATRPQRSPSPGAGLGLCLSQLKKEWLAQLRSLRDLTTPWNIASDLQALFHQNIWDTKGNRLFTILYLNWICITIATSTAVGSLSSCHKFPLCPYVCLGACACVRSRRAVTSERDGIAMGTIPVTKAPVRGAAGGPCL